MSLFNHISRLFFIDKLIEKQATGTPEQFARKNRLSKSGLLKVLQDMKRLGYPIAYNRSKQCYSYQEQGEKPVLGALKKMKFNLEDKMLNGKLTRNDLKKVLSSDPRVDYTKLCYHPVRFFEEC